MKLDPAEVWTAQEPPADFADRVLRAFAEERLACLPSRVDRWRARRSAVLLVAAAIVLVVGTAWAAWQRRDARTMAPPVTPVQVATPMPVTPVRSALPAPEVPIAPAPPAPLAPVVSVAPPRPRARPVPVPVVGSAVAAPRQVIVPPCICHDIACDCGPEP